MYDKNISNMTWADVKVNGKYRTIPRCDDCGKFMKVEDDPFKMMIKNEFNKVLSQEGLDVAMELVGDDGSDDDLRCSKCWARRDYHVMV